MKYIQFNPYEYTVDVTDGPKKDGVNIPVRGPNFKENPWESRISVSSLIYEHVLYRAMGAEDKRKGRKLDYSLVPPDPWLVGIGLVMWEGILHGLAWDTVKYLVVKAIETLKKKGVAPQSEDQEVTQKEATQLGFAWTNYLNGKKQYDMFVGLKRVYSRETKKNLRPNQSASRNRKRKSRK